MWPTGIQVLYGESTRVCGTGTKLLRQEFVREKNIAIIIYYSTYLYRLVGLTILTPYNYRTLPVQYLYYKQYLYYSQVVFTAYAWRDDNRYLFDTMHIVLNSLGTRQLHFPCEPDQILHKKETDILLTQSWLFSIKWVYYRIIIW